MEMDIRVEVGNRLYEYRAGLGLSREVFAERVGISPQFLAEIEHGRKGISVETLYKICTAFEISSDYLVFGKPNMNLGSPANLLLDNVPNEYMGEYMTNIGMINDLINRSKS